MKILFGLFLVFLSLMAVAGQRWNCPVSNRPNCICTADWNPVCSTIGCTYPNLCTMRCAGGSYWYNGECR